MRLFGAALLLLAFPLQAATVRGRLTQSVGGKSIPAGGVSVTLLDGAGKRSFAVTSDASGMYLFQSVSAGSYTLQVWRRPGGPPSTLPITVREPLLDVPPVNLQ